MRELRAIARERGLKRFTALRKAALIAFLENPGEQSTLKDLKAIAKERGLKKFTALRKDKLIAFLENPGEVQPTLKELRAEAKERGLKNYTALRKDKLIAFINRDEVYYWKINELTNKQDSDKVIAKINNEIRQRYGKEKNSKYLKSYFYNDIKSLKDIHNCLVENL